MSGASAAASFANRSVRGDATDGATALDGPDEVVVEARELVRRARRALWRDLQEVVDAPAAGPDDAHAPR